jgi:hypothetical protein
LTGETPPVTGETPPTPSVAAGRVLSIVGLVMAVALAFVTAVWEAFLTPLAVHWTSGGHAHSVTVPVALVCALVGNAALTWFTREVTGQVLTVLAPFVGWTVPMLMAASRTREGDLILTGNNWVGLATMVVGATAFAITAFWLSIRSLERSTRR